eukprot:GHUV01040767.1.p1 GENE.GHUV01040767.1~~GHUV01040767.1.p1  ORF type:complete len:144 (+),score=5.98 GHUV01040767.1:30-434(+)
MAHCTLSGRQSLLPCWTVGHATVSQPIQRNLMLNCTATGRTLAHTCTVSTVELHHSRADLCTGRLSSLTCRKVVTNLPQVYHPVVQVLVGVLQQLIKHVPVVCSTQCRCSARAQGLLGMDIEAGNGCTTSAIRR